MSATVLRAIDEDIQMHKNAIEQLNASIQIELNKIQALETARETFIKVMPVIVPVEKPSAPAPAPIPIETVPVIVSVEKPSAPALTETVPVKTSEVKPSSLDTLIKTLGVKPSGQIKKLIVKPVKSVVTELSSDNYLSDDKDFVFDQQFDVKCIRKEAGKAIYNLYHNGKLLQHINEKGEYSSNYMSGTKYTPFEPLKDESFKACLYYKDYEKVGGMIYFPKQSKQIPSNEQKSSHFKMIKEEFPSLNENK